jgi:hypothetical protein
MIESPNRARQLAPALAMVGALLGAGCILGPLPTSGPSGAATPTAIPTPTPTPSPSLTPSPEPTADPASIPAFEPGELAATTIAGMRVRRLPGTDTQVVTGLLPGQHELQVVMGPVPRDELGWYLVRDADAREPQFDEGWIAAGYEPDPFLMAAGHPPTSDPYPGGAAHTGNAEFGPIEVADEHHAIRWLALDPEGVGCSLAVSLAADSADPIAAIRATVGNATVPGTLQPSYFRDQPSLRGQLFVSVQSDCAWALAFVRIPPEPTPAP